MNDDARYQLRWQHSSGNVQSEATLATENTKDSPSKTSSNPAIQYVAFGTAQNGYDPILQINGVNPTSYFYAAQRGFSSQYDLTISNLNWQGDHTLKTGFKFKRVTLEDRDAGTEPLYAYYVTPTPLNPGDPAAGIDANPFQVTFGARGDPSISTTATSQNKQFGVYFQDDWAVTSRLVLNLGVRYDFEKTPSYTGYKTPQKYVDAIDAAATNGCAHSTPAEQAACPFYFNGAYHGADLAAGQTYRDTLRNAGINIDNYIGNGHNRKDPSSGIQPRLGFSFDLQGDQHHVVFGGVGRSYDRNVFSILEHESNKATLYVPTVHFFRDGTGCTGGTDPSCVAWDPKYLTADGLRDLANTLQPPNFGEMHFLNNRLKTPYSDQFSIGMRNRVGEWNTSITLARINSYDGLIATASNFYGDGTWQWWGPNVPGGYEGSYWGPDWAPIHNANGTQAGQGTLYLFDNAKKTTNTQVLVSLDKPYTVESHWSASIAYTYSSAYEKLESNGDYQLDFGHPSQAPFALSGNVPRHRLVAVGSIDGPWGLNFGGKLVLETPKAFQGCDGVNAVSDGFNYSCYTLGTYPTNTLGYKNVDLQVSKSLNLPMDSAFTLRVDLLNATNAHNFAFLTYGSQPKVPRYVTDGNITGVPRTLKVSLNYKW